jgi:tRNA nucleotidyltransferase (CCA-adding enzyme)
LTILPAIHPDLVWNERISSQVESLPSKTPPGEWLAESDFKDLPLHRSLFYILWLMQSPEKSKVSTRLRLVSSLAEVIRQAAHLRKVLFDFRDLKPSQITTRLDRVPNLAIYAVYLDCDEAALKGILSRYLSSWQHVNTSITGKDLQEAGLDPGPRYAEILTELRSAWLDGEISSDKEEQTFLEKLLAEEFRES